jgi:endonuclease G
MFAHDKTTRARARIALDQAVRAHLFDPNVRMVDFGLPHRGRRLCEDEVAIRVHVRRKLAEASLARAEAAGQTARVPPSIGGFATDVLVGRYRPHFVYPPPARSTSSWRRGAVLPATRASRAEPMRGGISISDAGQYTYGTLGALVFDRATGTPMILSNWHVLVGNWWARAGQAIYQPGRLDGGSYTDTVARTVRDAMPANLDAAVAALTGVRDLVNDQMDLGPVRGLADAAVGMRVVKSGRASGITSGRVTAIEGTARLWYAGVERMIRRCVTIEPDVAGAQVSTGGDSGSLWLDADSLRAVALHFAGSDTPERALGIDLTPILDVLQVRLATSAP